MNTKFTLVFSAIIIIAILFWRHTGWVKMKNFEDFKANNPNSFNGNRFISCPKCGGNYIYIRSNGMLNSHICRQCGKELWRSRS